MITINVVKDLGRKDANDIVYLRARNITAARGNVTGSRLVAEYIS